MIGKTLGHYRIVEKIGEGGMGEIYRARDEHLNRDVAIKVLPPDTLADEHARKRFRKEALALSKLNHPHIESVHDFDTQAGVDFLVMELIPGVTMEEKLATGPLPEKEIARLGTQLVEGLAAAHEQRVIHRDLKPGNLRVTPDGRVKILDFGLAKLLRPVSEEAAREGTTETTTETRALLGTPPYMTPEQLRGEPLDARTDIHAVGAVLYEMATGRCPFEEKLASALIDSILHKPPPPPGRLRPDLSTRLEEIILKCLEKEPESRYQSARELLVDLRRVAAPEALRVEAKPYKRLRWLVPALLAVLVVAVVGVVGYFTWQRFWPAAKPPAGKIMLAVLPFDNLSADPEQEYFSDGMTEEMIAQLGSLHPQRLGVIARTSAMKYKDTDKGIDEIGRELGVDYLLEGSVRRAGERVRITAQLIQVSDQTHLWAESYGRDLADILAIQSEVSQRIARSLALELLPTQQARLASARPVNPEAYEAYLKGRYYWDRFTEENWNKAIQYFQQAIEKDPTYAAAYAGLSDSYALLGSFGHLRPKEAHAKSKGAALKALEIDDSLAEVHLSVGLAKLLGWDWPGAEGEIKRAIKLNPSYAQAHGTYAVYLTWVGRHDEAISEIQQARELDPLSLTINNNVAWVAYMARQYERAIEEYRKTLELDPNFVMAHRELGWLYVQKGMYEKAIAESQTAVSVSSDDFTLASLGYVYAMAGQPHRALNIASELRERSKRRYMAPFNIAMVYVGLSKRDQAFTWLHKAYEDHSGRMPNLRVWPHFDPLRDDPRFQSILRRMNFPE